MLWFGKSWGAPACDPDDHRPTPVGEACAYCDGPIADDAQGVLIPHLDHERASLRPWHLGCFLRSMGLAPTVHILAYGRALCDRVQGVPGTWPEGYRWVSFLDNAEANCPECKARFHG